MSCILCLVYYRKTLRDSFLVSEEFPVLPDCRLPDILRHGSLVHGVSISKPLIIWSFPISRQVGSLTYRVEIGNG